MDYTSRAQPFWATGHRCNNLEILCCSYLVYLKVTAGQNQSKNVIVNAKKQQIYCNIWYLSCTTFKQLWLGIFNTVHCSMTQNLFTLKPTRYTEKKTGAMITNSWSHHRLPMITAASPLVGVISDVIWPHLAMITVTVIAAAIQLWPWTITPITDPNHNPKP